MGMIRATSEKVAERERLRQETEEFLRQGGTIQRVPRGVGKENQEDPRMTVKMQRRTYIKKL